jgi:hypothetical protein
MLAEGALFDCSAMVTCWQTCRTAGTGWQASDAGETVSDVLELAGIDDSVMQATERLGSDGREAEACHH